MTTKTASHEFDILPEDIQHKALRALDKNNIITVVRENLYNVMGQIWGWGFGITIGADWPDDTAKIRWEPLSDGSFEATLLAGFLACADLGMGVFLLPGPG